MTCRRCRRQVGRAAAFCGGCGLPQHGSADPFDLVLADGSRVEVATPLTVGRGAECDVRVDDPSVSRTHLRLDPRADGLHLLDAGSSYGTLLDGRPLTGDVRAPDHARLEVGDVTLRLERRRPEHEAGRTMIVPVGASVALGAVGATLQRSEPGAGGRRPRLRSGWALKRLDATGEERRWVLRDLRQDAFVRLDDDAAALVPLLDGQHELAELVAVAQERSGARGATRLAWLLTDLARRGLLEGHDAAGEQEGKRSLFRRILGPRRVTWKGLDPVVQRLYRSVGWPAFTGPGRLVLAALALAGLGSFVALVVGRYGTPFIVADRVGLGAAVFIVGRVLLALAHELAHGLALASHGRSLRVAGLVFYGAVPFAYVDTSEGWFEGRRARIEIGLAGPASDAVLGGVLAIACLVSPAGNVRDILFQLALGGYIALLLNLNPVLDRDGYQVLSDVLHEPGLRAKARTQLARRVSGEEVPSRGGLLVFGALGAGWTIALAAGLAGVTALAWDAVTARVPGWVVLTMLGTVGVLSVLPALLTLGPPLLTRARRPPALEGNRVVR